MFPWPNKAFHPNGVDKLCLVSASAGGSGYEYFQFSPIVMGDPEKVGFADETAIPAAQQD